MNKNTLQLAIDSAKMMFLLAKGVLTQAQVSLLRARLDEAVYVSVRLGQLNTSSSDKLSTNLYISNMHAVFLEEMRLLSVDAMVEKGSEYRWMLSNGAASVPQARGISERLLGIPQVDFKKIVSKITSQREELNRGGILHTFSSVVRNDQWLHLLLTLNAQHPVRLNAILVQEHSSRQGLEERMEKFDSLVSETMILDASIPVAAVEPTMLAGLTVKFLGQHPKVLPILQLLKSGSATIEVVNKLFNEAAKVEEIAQSNVAEFIKNRLDALVKGLTQQKNIYEREVKEKRAVVKREKEEAAVLALKGMGAHLAVLAANPELLARALEAAGLAPKKVAITKDNVAVKKPAKVARAKKA